MKEKYLSDNKVKYFQISKFDSFDNLINKILRWIKKKVKKSILTKKMLKYINQIIIQNFIVLKYYIFIFFKL